MYRITRHPDCTQRISSAMESDTVSHRPCNTIFQQGYKSPLVSGLWTRRLAFATWLGSTCSEKDTYDIMVGSARVAMAWDPKFRVPFMVVDVVIVNKCPQTCCDGTSFTSAPPPPPPSPSPCLGLGLDVPQGAKAPHLESEAAYPPPHPAMGTKVKAPTPAHG